MRSSRGLWYPLLGNLREVVHGLPLDQDGEEVADAASIEPLVQSCYLAVDRLCVEPRKALLQPLEEQSKCLLLLLTSHDPSEPLACLRDNGSRAPLWCVGVQAAWPLARRRPFGDSENLIGRPISVRAAIGARQQPPPDHSNLRQRWPGVQSGRRTPRHRQHGRHTARIWDPPADRNCWNCSRSDTTRGSTRWRSARTADGWPPARGQDRADLALEEGSDNG
jgi:hypothetical protein